MGQVQNYRMERAKRAFKEELFHTDKSRAFYVDCFGNALGFTIERADGGVLSYNGETGRYEPFEVLPEDGAINITPYDYKDRRIVNLLSEEPAKNIQRHTCFYARYFCGEFDAVIPEAEYRRLEETGELYHGDTLDYAPIFNNKIYPYISESSSAQISMFGYHYDDDRRTIPSKAELAVAGIELTLNTKISYLYRDADNYKVWNECVVAGILTQEQKQQILDCRLDGEWFIPNMVGLPEKQFDEWDDQSDHPYFELYDHSFEEVTLSPTVSVKAADLVFDFARCKEAKWDERNLRSGSLKDIIADAEQRSGKKGPTGPDDVEKAKNPPSRPKGRLER